MAASPDAVLQLVALHTLAQAGFASTSRAASMTLSSVLARYLENIAASCAERAALAGRTKVAAVDVVTALEDMGMGGVAELEEWTADLDKEVVLTGGKLGKLAGEAETKGCLSWSCDAEDDEVAAEDEDESDEDEESEHEPMDVDPKPEALSSSPVKSEVASPPRVWYRPQSPDMSWLPPLPSDTGGSVFDTTSALGPVESVPAPQSVLERYRRPVAYSASQLAEAHEFVDPPTPAVAVPLPPAPSSFSSLLTTYEATAKEPSVAFRQTEGRRQVADLLRLTVANPDVFSTKDTLAQALPPPHLSPIVASHSDVLPPTLLPVNPNQSGIISSLIRQVRSPFLPPMLRERLTSLRPPQVQTNDSGPIFYGDPVRGPDEAALAKARGKATGEEPEVYLRATWDSGPRGAERWQGRNLPEGRKVIRRVDGETLPRESEGAKDLRIKLSKKATGGADPRGPSPGPSSAPPIKLRLGGPSPPRPNQNGSATRPNGSSSHYGFPGSQPMGRSSSASSSNSGRGGSRPKSRSASPSKWPSSPVKQEMVVD
ncbi:hypothetical protein VHUM_00414 [Vanrija humicola]|uniref:Bromodomain associated domain-containing protein n=1 Tax=Vanrija humicola TaxID=5417 RepID=A0A7D8VD72_VANHU|nr:hypothetical protein VHUM_00414 [Vanrija humicola]